jgi:hypothetical protein
MFTITSMPESAPDANAVAAPVCRIHCTGKKKVIRGFIARPAAPWDF